jgi:hypothetical protein
VAHIHALWYFAMKAAVRHPMGINRLAVKLHLAITSAPNIELPFPAAADAYFNARLDSILDYSVRVHEPHFRWIKKAAGPIPAAYCYPTLGHRP